ncbi:DNA/RNA non-specific endonuclease [Azospirillum sp.]|uniref:DNA/RNA non-specific endonuclease n=1 Tax=Azospirillum sp. TaxID=34012 RepID=UPI003D72AEE7
MLRILAFAAALLAAPAAAFAAPSACPQHFAGGDAPDLLNQRLAAKTRALCYGGYAVLHSGVTRTPLYAAERLTRERIAGADAIQRRGKFHADPNLPRDERAELADYARSGFDRGHMAPAGDMPDFEQQNESFSLANMIPQNPESNRDLWSDIEAVARALARRQGDLYVVSGPVYRGDRIERLNERVLIPTHVFKALYDPVSGQAGAYLVPNAEGDEWTPLSISQLRDLTGIDVFPALPPSVKDVAMPLPDPEPRRRRPQVGERR